MVASGGRKIREGGLLWMWWGRVQRAEVVVGFVTKTDGNLCQILYVRRKVSYRIGACS
jgi:hypothetical protein